MYYLFAKHHLLPSVYYGLGDGEKKIVQAFVSYQAEEEDEIWEAMEGGK